MTDASHVLATAETDMQSVASADEASLSSGSRCYFSVANRSDHDVAPYLRCGPILLPWSSPSSPWLTYELRASSTTSGADVSLVSQAPPDATTKLNRGEVLRRPDGANAPSGTGGLALPVVPRQRAGWSGVLSSPPLGLGPAPVGERVSDAGPGWRFTLRSSIWRASLSGRLIRNSRSPRHCCSTVDPRREGYSWEVHPYL